MNYTLNVVVLVPSVPTPPAAMISSEADTYLGLFIMAAFWAFFSAAVVALSEREMSQKSAERWAVSMAVRNPKLFGQAAAFSLGWSGAEKGVGEPGQPRLFLSAGSFESVYYKATLALAGKAGRSGGEVVLRKLVSDHDDAAWRPMLVEALRWWFGKPA